MAGTELGKAWVQIVPSADGIAGSVQKILDPEADAAGKSAGNKLMGTLKKAIAGAGLGATLKKTLDFGAELQQNLGGSEAVFGEYAKSVQNTAKEAYKNMGLSASDYMATANKMGSLFQGSGVEQSKALALTTDAMQRAADVASVMGIDTSMAMESIAGAAKGNFTMMDNLGVAMNATTLQAYALEKGVNFEWNTASNAEKAELAMRMFMDKTSQYEGNFARESEETFSGSIGAMKASVQDLMANLMLGENVTESMQNVATTVTTFIGGNLIPSVGRIFMGLPEAVMTALDTLVPALTNGLSKAASTVKEKFPQMLQSALQGLLQFSGNIREKAGDLVNAGLELIKNLADGIIQNIPTIIETVPTIISNFAGIINDNAPKLLSAGLNIIKNLAVGLIEAIPVLVKNLPKIIKAIWNVFTAIQWMSLGKTIIKNLGGGIKNAESLVKAAVKNIVEKVKTTIKDGFDAAKSAALKVFDGLKNGIKDKLNAAKDIISGIIEKIKGMFPFSIGKVFSGWIPKIKLWTNKNNDSASTDSSVSRQDFAKAMTQPYVFKKPTEFYAGDAGDEVLFGRSALLKDLKEATSGGHTFNITLNANGAENPEQYAQRFTRELRRQVRMGTI